MRLSFISYATVAIFAIASSAFAADLSIATGKEGGGYDAAARTAATKLAQRGNVVEVINLNGSDEITLAVCSGRATAGYTQIDAMDARAKEGCNLRPLSNYGNGEYAVILFPPDSDLDALDDLTSANSVLVDTIGSGTSLFWDTIVRIEKTEGSGDPWSEASAINDPLSMAEPLANFGDIDAVIMVRTETSPDIANLVSRGWKMGELWDRQIDDYEFNGKPLYEVSKKAFTINSRKTTAYTYKVLSFAVTTEATSRDRELFAMLAGAM